MNNQITEKFQEQSGIKLMVIGQDFSNEIAGVGVVSNLGMDLALMRQKENPQVIGYYGADTVFDEEWVNQALKGYKQKDVDGVRGRQKSAEISNIVEDENGLHVLSQEEVDKIVDLEEKRFKFEHQLQKYFDSKKADEGMDKKKQAVGIATQTAGTYAMIGGMSIKGIGEDIQIAQDVADKGNIYYNKDMVAAALGRIEKPRTGEGSYTGGLWKVFRAYQYGEGDVLDSQQRLMVISPERKKFDYEIEKFIKSGDAPPKVKDFFTEEEAQAIEEAKQQSGGNMEEFRKIFIKNKEMVESLQKRIDEKYPPKTDYNTAVKMFEELSQ